jgi:hypothetical protein
VLLWYASRAVFIRARVGQADPGHTILIMRLLLVAGELSGLALKEMVTMDGGRGLQAKPSVEAIHWLGGPPWWWR